MSEASVSRAWQVASFGEPRDVLSLREIPTPEPGPGELRVRVAANGLNFLDASICRGDHPVRPALPFVPGAELVGVVSAVGSDTSAEVDDRVVAISPTAHGCFREEAVVPAFAALPVPEDIPDEHAAALLVTYQTAFVALCRRASIRQGEWVLVHAGAGGLGTALIQVARARGAHVIATAGSQRKVEVCLEQGAVAALNYRTDDLRNTVMDITDGRGVDVVCDQVGGDVFSRSLECVAFEGRLLPLGWASGTMPALEAGSVVARNISVVGVSWGSTYPQVAGDVVRTTHEELIRMYRSKAIKPFVSGVVSAADLPSALQQLADGESIGKTIVTWPEA